MVVALLFFWPEAKKLLQSSIPFTYRISNTEYPSLFIIIAKNFAGVLKQNLHTHTHYCDGSSAPEEYVKAAIRKGFRSLGFSGHAPVPFDNNFAIRDIHSLKDYVREIRELSEKYKKVIKIFLALEADYIPGITLNFQRFVDDFGLDYIIGSVHLVSHDRRDLWFIDGPDRSVWEHGLATYFDGDIKKAVSRYYHQINDMIETQKPDVIGHLDKIKMHNRGVHFSEEEPWYRNLVMETLSVAKQNDSIVEVNTRGIYKKRSDSLFPGEEILKVMKKMNIPVCINADAHRPEEVHAGLDKAAKALIKIGYRDVCVFTDKGWDTESLD